MVEKGLVTFLDTGLAVHLSDLAGEARETLGWPDGGGSVSTSTSTRAAARGGEEKSNENSLPATILPAPPRRSPRRSPSLRLLPLYVARFCDDDTPDAPQ